ncbi:MAG: hypothetical protein ACI9DF_005949, partial [Verrucomicrobiales bacterium]
VVLFSLISTITIFISSYSANDIGYKWRPEL